MFQRIGTCRSSLTIDDIRLLDPKGMNDRTSNTSNVSSGRANFKQDLVTRDRRCVMTGTINFQACHIIPHAKGDQVRFGRPFVSFTSPIPDKVHKQPHQLQGTSHRPTLRNYRRYPEWDPAWQIPARPVRGLPGRLLPGQPLGAVVFDVNELNGFARHQTSR